MGGVWSDVVGRRTVTEKYASRDPEEEMKKVRAWWKGAGCTHARLFCVCNGARLPVHIGDCVGTRYQIHMRPSIVYVAGLPFV